MIMKRVMSLVAIMLVSAMAYAGGFRVALQGQRSLAMGHTGVAVIHNAESAFFNPAGLIHLENKINVAVGGFGVFSDVKYQNTQFGQTAQTESGVGTPFYLYASYGVSEKLAIGLAVYTPYGSAVEYPTDWAGSHLVNNIDLQAIYIQPTVSVQVFDDLSIGGGPIMAIGAVNFNRNLNRNATDLEGNRSNVTLDASNVTAFGFTVGALLTPDDKWSFGLNYRSQIDIEAEGGDATFANVANTPLSPVENGTVKFDASIPLPAEWSLGLSYKASDKWLFAFDWNYTEWDAYQSLDIDFIPEDVPDSFNARNYKNSSNYRFGTQYTATNKLIFRAGYYFDESPVQEGFFAPETPRNDSHGITGGLSYNVSDKLAIDVSFLYLMFAEVDASYDSYTENGERAPFSGTYRSSAFAPGIGLSYKL